MKKIILAALLALLAASPAFAQSSPNIFQGQIPSPGQWNAWFQGKNDTLGYTPVNKAGDTMQGELITSPSSTVSSGFNLPPGSAPTSPVNGDLFATSAGVYAQVAGSTIGPFAGANSTSFAATLPIAVTFPSNVVTYALNFNTSLVKDGSNNLGINLAHSNAFTAAQTIASASANAFSVGLNGATNPAFNVDASTASSATGLNIKSAAAAGGVAVSVISSGSNEALTINAKGSGTIGIGSVSTGAVTITPATTLSAALTYGGVTLSNSVTGTGSMVLSAAPTITLHPTIEGVTSTGATGTGNFVFSASPTVTGTLTAATSSFSGHMTIEGVTSTGAAGTGNFVFATAPTVSSLTVTTAFTATGLVTNADLANTATTVNGQTCTLGSTCTISASAGTITPGTTTVASGTTNGLLYDNAGTLGNLATANNGVLITSGAGVPSISTTIPNATQLNITALGTIGTGIWNGSAISNSYLVNSTISGVSLGSNLFALTFGTHLAAGGSSFNGTAAVTITSDATNANTASTIVARDASNNFSAGTITASLTGHASLDCALAGCAITGASSIAGLTVTTSLTATGLVTSADLANTAVSAASYGSSTSIPSFTVNAEGQLTAAAGNVVIAPAGTLTGTTLASNVVTSSLTSVGTLAGLTVTSSLTATGLITLADLATQAANTVLVNATAGAASPTAQAVGSCSSAGQALIWTTNTGFGCGTITATASAVTIGTTTITSGATNTLLYQNGASPTGTIGEIATANSGVLITSGAGVPSISSTLPSGIAATNMSLTTPTLGVAAGTSLALGGATIGGNALAVTGSSAIGTLASAAATVTSASANALAVGLNGTTNPALNVDASTASAATGINIKSAAAAGGLAVSVLSSGSNEALTINAKGSGTIGIGSVSTGAVTITPALTLSAALTYGSVTLSNSVTGTGSMVLSASPTLTGTANVAALTASGILGTSSAGSAAAPSIAVGNATTGLYSVSTTGIGVSVNGVLKVDYGITTGSTLTTNALTVTGNVKFSGASGGTIAYALCTDSSGNIVPNSSANCYAGGSAAAAGISTQVQYNSGGSLAANAGFTFDGTSVLSLGVVGTSVGGVKFFDATSGYLELVPTTGALGSAVLTLPDTTDQLVARATTDTLTNKSIAGSEINSSLVAATYGGTGVNNGSKTLTLGGSLTTTGAAAPTLAFGSGSYTYTFAASANDTVATLGTASQAMSGGVHLTSYSIGTESSGTYTVDCGNNPGQFLLDAGAFTLAAPVNDSNCLVQVVAGPGAGAVTLSGFSTSPSSNGDTFSTTSTTSGTATFTNSSASISFTNIFVPGNVVYFTTTGGLPTNFSASTIYYVISTGLTGSAFEVSATPGGSAITAGSAGTGTQTVYEPATFAASIIRINGLANLIWKQQQ